MPDFAGKVMRSAFYFSVDDNVCSQTFARFYGNNVLTFANFVFKLTLQNCDYHPRVIFIFLFSVLLDPHVSR